MGVRVEVIGKHPWTGHTGTLVSVAEPKTPLMPKMGRVELDNGNSCFAQSKNLRAIAKREFDIQVLRDIR